MTAGIVYDSSVAIRERHQWRRTLRHCRAFQRPRTREAFWTAAALCRFWTRPMTPSSPAGHRPPPHSAPRLWTLDFGLWTATPASWPAQPGCGAKRPCRSSGLRRGCRSARPKGPSPCSLIWFRAKTNANCVNFSDTSKVLEAPWEMSRARTRRRGSPKAAPWQIPATEVCAAFEGG